MLYYRLDEVDAEVLNRLLDEVRAGNEDLGFRELLVYRGKHSPGIPAGLGSAEQSRGDPGYELARFVSSFVVYLRKGLGEHTKQFLD